MNEEIKNAKITATSLGYVYNEILSCWITLDYGDSGQNFGGYAFCSPVKKDGKFSHREATDFGMKFIKKILDVVGVETWEELKGKHVRVISSHSNVSAIGNILKDDWFYPEKLKGVVNE